MISAKDEAQSIKRIDVINPITFKGIKTCQDLIELCDDMLENVNINISQFVIENNLYGYSGNVNINESMEIISLLRDNINSKKSVVVNLDGIIDSICDINKARNFSEIMLIYGAYKMYLGEFTSGIGIIEFSRDISGKKDDIVTSIERLNEFIFKFNLSVDITRLNNLVEASDILESYYDLSMRINRGDHLLITIFDNLKKRKKSQRILESIYNISSNALFHYEIGKKEYRLPKKSILAAIILLVGISAGVYYLSFKGEATETISTPPKTTSKIEPIKKEESKIEQPKKEEVNTIVTLDALKKKMLVAANAGDYGFIDKGVVSLPNEVKESKEYKAFIKEYNIKKQGYYYNKGREDMKSENIQGAIENFKAAYKGKTGEYLDPHITYSLGCAVMKNKQEDAVKYFEEYLTYNKMDVSYEEESLYNLAMINMNIGNKSKAKKYAQRLQDRYSDSIYNNGKLKQILQ
ncbi:MAG: tetratricopeptide repeat protein [Clostridium sp.]